MLIPKHRLRVLGVFLIGASCSVVWGEPAAKKLESIASIDYRGVGFSTSEKEFLKTFPNAVPDSRYADSGTGVSTYDLREDPAVDCVLLRFAEGKLVEVKYFYFPTRVASMGGLPPLNNLAISEYGEPTHGSGDSFSWEYPDIDRSLFVSNENGSWTLRLICRSRCDAIADYQDISVVTRSVQMHVAEGIDIPVQPRKSHHIAAATLEAIERNAQLDHPFRASSQEYEIGRQVRSHVALNELECPKNMSPNLFKFLKERTAREHPEDFSTQAYALKRELSAFAELANMKAPASIAGSHYFKMRASAAQRFPYDYSTQLYVLNNYMDDYLKYRRAGNSGEAIMRHLLRFD